MDDDGLDVAHLEKIFLLWTGENVEIKRKWSSLCVQKEKQKKKQQQQ